MEPRSNHSNPKGKRRFLKWFLIILLIIILATVAYGLYLYKAVLDSVEHIHEDLDRGDFSDKRTEEADLSSREPVSILLLGIDAEEGERGRTDTIMVMTINPLEKSAHILSIPRDTRTEIVGRGVQDKINHAYAFGGINMTINSVENLLDIPIDYYASVNMDGFVSMIDVVGGVTVDVEFSFEEDGFQFTPGLTEMDGEKALAFSRMRKQDPRGDFGRNDRQQQIIKALLQEAVSISSLWNVTSILQEIELHVNTNIAQHSLTRLARYYIAPARHPERLALEGQGRTINGIYYYVVPDENLQLVRTQLREHLALD